MRPELLYRRYWVAGAIVVLVVAVIYGQWADERVPPVRPALPPTLTLEEVYRDALADGWQIKHPPDLPGPYRRRLPGALCYHPGPGGTSNVRFREPSGAVVWEEQTRPGVVFLTLVLETVDGRRTEGLLVRGE